MTQTSLFDTKRLYDENEWKKSIKRPHAVRTHCYRGHEFTPDNVYLTNRGARQCRTCNRMRWLARAKSRPDLPNVSKKVPAEERFWTKVDKNGPNGCWIWTGSKTELGYGHFSVVNGKSSSAHRFAYELVIGPIPKGLELDHLCRFPSCVNPSHLEPVTGRENKLRGTSFSAVNAAKTHCKRGHEFDYRDAKGSRICLTCKYEKRARRRAEEAARGN